MSVSTGTSGMTPICGWTPWASWNSALVASWHTSISELAGACARSAVEHTALAIIPEPIVHLHHPRMVTSWSGASEDGAPSLLPGTHERAGTSLKRRADWSCFSAPNWIFCPDQSDPSFGPMSTARAVALLLLCAAPAAAQQRDAVWPLP